MSSLGIRALNKVLNELRTSYYAKRVGQPWQGSGTNAVGAGAQGQSCMPPPRKTSPVAARNFMAFTLIGLAILVLLVVCFALGVPLKGPR